MPKTLSMSVNLSVFETGKRKNYRVFFLYFEIIIAVCFVETFNKIKNKKMITDSLNVRFFKVYNFKLNIQKNDFIFFFFIFQNWVVVCFLQNTVHQIGLIRCPNPIYCFIIGLIRRIRIIGKKR